MQRVESVEFNKLEEIISAVFQEPAVAYQAYSDFGTALKRYESEEELMHALDTEINRNCGAASFSIYYPEAKGYFFAEKKNLNPDKCNGATFRYVAAGWGLVQLQIDLKNGVKPEVRVAVNTQKRAQSWAATYPDYKNPSLWDWKYVERQARRIIRALSRSA